jgi:hypothetical protein
MKLTTIGREKATLRSVPPNRRPPHTPQPETWKQHGWRTMRSAHVTQDRVFYGARAFVVGTEIVEGVRVSARAISALHRHAETYVRARAEGKPTCEPETAERRAA